MLPQLDYATYSSQIFWLFTHLSILFCAIYYFIIPKLDNIIEKRAKLIQQNTLCVLSDRQLIETGTRKYKDAMSKAESLAKDIIADNKVLMQEKKSQELQKLRDDVETLHENCLTEIEQFKNKIRSDIIEETAKVTSIYYRKLILEELDENMLSDLKKEIKEGSW